MSELLFYFTLFITYSFVGWIFEVICVFYSDGRFVDRGFLIGPYCPIYGFSGLIMSLTLNRYMDDPIILFIVIVVIASVMEYITSYLMEKIFKARWWDYSKMTFNINGRICLEISILFGILGFILMYIMNPHLTEFLKHNNGILLTTLSSFILFLFVVDSVVSFNVIRKLQLTTEAIKKDYTGEITEKVREIIYQKSRLARRLLSAFPDFRTINIRMKRKK